MDVCQHSGLPLATCTWCCTHCPSKYVACPIRTAIYIAAAEIRLSWPPARLEKQEGRCWELDIPEAHKITDHMRRKPRQED